MDLKGKVAIVTGAGSGIGHAIAERFAEAGAAVCVNYFGYEDAAKALAARLPRAIAVRADVSSAADVAAMVDSVCRELGVPTVLVNNAGIEKEVPFLDLAANQDALARAIMQKARPAFAELGLSLEGFQIQNISLPDDLQKRLDERIGMGIVGDLGQ